MYPGTNAQLHPDKAAYIMAGSGETVTYRELDERSNRLAHLFRETGLEAGDGIALFMENHARFLEIAWAAQRSGLFFTPVSSRLTSEEVAYIVNDCGARAVFATGSLADIAREIPSQTPGVELFLSCGGPIDGFEEHELVAQRYPAMPIKDESEGYDLLYSSGTTGRPKGVKLPTTFKPAGTPDAVVMLVKFLYEATDKSIYLSPAPLYHAAPLRFTMGFTRIGATAVIMEHFDPVEYLSLIERYGVTHTQLVPTMFVRLLKLDEEARTRHDLSSLHAAIHASAPCPADVKKKMIEWWGPIIHEYYAGTEANGFVACNSKEWLAHEGTVGKALVGTIHITDDSGKEVPVGTDGTVYFESEGMSFEYLNDPEKTASSRHAKGWSTLGDIGHLDEDGFLYLTDRKAYMIISGGVNIYPQEAENVLVTHPKVMDVAVFGVPNEEMGEEVKGVVQLVDPADATDATAHELLEYCRLKLAHLKCPRTIDFEEELPRHPNGKLYKRILRDRYWTGHTSRIV